MQTSPLCLPHALLTSAGGMTGGWCNRRSTHVNSGVVCATRTCLMGRAQIHFGLGPASAILGAPGGGHGRQAQDRARPAPGKGGPPGSRGRCRAAAWRPGKRRRGTGSTWARPARTPRTPQSQSWLPRQMAACLCGPGPRRSTRDCASSGSLPCARRARASAADGMALCLA